MLATVMLHRTWGDSALDHPKRGRNLVDPISLAFWPKGGQGQKAREEVTWSPLLLGHQWLILNRHREATWGEVTMGRVPCVWIRELFLARKFRPALLHCLMCVLRKWGLELHDPCLSSMCKCDIPSDSPELNWKFLGRRMGTKGKLSGESSDAVIGLFSMKINHCLGPSSGTHAVW